VIAPLTFLKNVVSTIGWLVLGGTSDDPLLSHILAVWGHSVKQIFGTTLLTKKWHEEKIPQERLYNTAVVECPGAPVETNGSCHAEGSGLGFGHIVRDPQYACT
jgi:hypothetical protein